jgi:hypothetical protein
MPPASNAPAQVEWVADLTLEFNERPAARLVTREGRCSLEISSLTAFRSLGPAIAGLRGLIPSNDSSDTTATWWEPLARGLPPTLYLVLHGIPIGQWEPQAPPNWTSRNLGLPFGHLTLEKMALLRATMKGGLG